MSARIFLVAFLIQFHPAFGASLVGDEAARPARPHARGLQRRSCPESLISAGEALALKDLIRQQQNRQRFLEEIDAWPERLNQGYIPVKLNSERSAVQLKERIGPLVTFASFSQEVDAEVHQQISAHSMAIVSALQHQQVIWGSGGTMGEWDKPTAWGGGVGVAQYIAAHLGLPTLSISTSKAYNYFPAPAEYFLEVEGSWGAESAMMQRLSDALVVIGGGNQSAREAREYFIHNPEGILVLVDDPRVGGSSEAIARDPEILALAEHYPNRMIVASNGTEAGQALLEALEFTSTVSNLEVPRRLGINVFNRDMDFSILNPGSRVIGFSGYSDWSKTTPDLVGRPRGQVRLIQRALSKINRVIGRSELPVIYATAGNDPSFPVKAFETLVHELPEFDSIKYLALTSDNVDLGEINERMIGLSFVGKDWSLRTKGFLASIDMLVTSGGNSSVLDQASQAKRIGKRHLHIKGANSTLDIALNGLRSDEGFFLLEPQQIIEMPNQQILEMFFPSEPAQ